MMMATICIIIPGSRLHSNTLTLMRMSPWFILTPTGRTFITDIAIN